MGCIDILHGFTGICIEPRIDLGNTILSLIGAFGLWSIYLAYRQLKFGQQAQKLQASATRARFVLDLNQQFFGNDDERDFFYKIDYKDFIFEPDKFAQSIDERQLDRLLYKLSYVGKLLRDGLVTLDDINNVRHIAARTLRNEEVIKYLRFLKEEQVPDHSSFSDAVFLFEKMFGKRDTLYPAIHAYLSRNSAPKTPIESRMALPRFIHSGCAKRMETHSWPQERLVQSRCLTRQPHLHEPRDTYGQPQVV